MATEFKTPVVVPANARPCVRCKVLMPIPGIVMASDRDPRFCSDCEPFIKEFDMSRVNQEQIDRARVQTWAAWRRDGKTYDEITELDTLQPSYPPIKKYLGEYGFAPDGQPLDGDGHTLDEAAPDLSLPDGWGDVEVGVLSPTQAQNPFAVLADRLRRAATREWARIQAPSRSAQYNLRRRLIGFGDVEATGRTIDGRRFIYFRRITEDPYADD